MAFGPDNSPSRRSAAMTALWLGLLVATGLFLRIGFSAQEGFDEASGRYMYTGNDPYYHDRTVHHILDTGQHLSFDPAINYPDGGHNPNPPLYTWTTAPVAAILEMTTDAPDPVGLALNVMVAVWGALIVIPVYLLGRDLWGRATGLWAAFFMAISAPHIERSIFGYADHDATTLFFIVFAFAFLVKALQATRRKEYVSDWRHADARRAGLRAVFAENRTAFLWSALCGVALTATALTWKGYPYVLAIMAVSVALQLLNDHLRNRDSTPVFLLYLIPLAMIAVLPYLFFYRAFPTFIDTTVIPSLIVLLGVVVLGLLLVPTRRLPSILVFPSLLAMAVVGLAVLYFFVPALWNTIFTGLGYFQQSKLYSTIAEAQRTSLGRVAASFGFFTFLMAFWGLGKVIRGAYRGEGAFTLMFAWSLVALFMAFAASRFVVNAAPLFSILTAAATVHLASKFRFADVRRRFQARPGGAVSGALGSLDTRATLGILIVGVLLVVPNVWIGVDAAMPGDYEADKGLNAQYWGAFGINYELADNGWLPTMAYLATLDTCRSGSGVCQPGDAGFQPIEERPAFLAWWDYGHWATGIGHHPSVADPFQSHFEAAGRFLASESEEEGAAMMSALLVYADRSAHGGSLSAPVAAALAGHGIPADAFDRAVGYQDYINALNLTTDTDPESPFSIYEDLAAATGKRIQYLGVDSRMYPLSAQNEGIFYAPVYLANKNPDDFIAVRYPAGVTTLTMKRYTVDAYGDSRQLSEPVLVDGTGAQYEIVGNRAYPVGRTPLQGYSEETGLQLQQAQLDVKERFGRTLYARAFGGFVAEQPSGDGLRHWRTIQESIGNVSNFQIRRTALLEYFHGVHLSGRVLDDAGAPMVGLEVTVRDGFGATHDSAVTGTDGRYQILAPFSHDGDLTLLVRSAGTVLLEDPTAQFTREEAREGAERTQDLTVARADLFGHTYRDVDGVPGFNGTVDEAIPGVAITYGNRTETSDSLGLYALTDLQAGTYTLRLLKEGYTTQPQPVVLLAGESKTFDLPLTPKPSAANLTLMDGGEPVPGVPLEIRGPTSLTATTGVDGVAHASLLPGSYNVTVDHTFTNAEGLEVRYDRTESFMVPFGGAPFERTIQAR